MTHAHAPQPSSVRFPVQPRLVPPAKAARYLHLTLPEFLKLLPALQLQGFPKACPITGNYDMVAIDAWQDRRSGLAGTAAPSQSSAEIAKARLATLG